MSHNPLVRVDHVDAAGRKAASAPIFVGTVETQTVIGDQSGHLRVTEVTFRDGARNRLHAHATDQVLIVTAGEGIVATREREEPLRPGDVAFIPVGEPHWHGAVEGRDMTHWAVLGPGETRVVE